MDSSNSPIISSSAGDTPVVSAGFGAQPNNKRWAIIALIVIFVVGIVAGVGWLMSRGGDDGDNVAGYETAFNRYANYFLEGETKDVAINSEVSEDDSYFTQAFNSLEYNQEYFSNLKKYYENFYNLYNVELDADSYIKSLLEQYNSKLNLVLSYRGGAVLMRNDILKSYLDGGEDEANVKISSILEPYKGIRDIYDLNYYNYAMDYGKETLSLIKNYEEIGCLKDDVIDYECTTKNANEKSAELALKLSEDDYYMKMILNNSKADIYDEIFVFNYYIYDNGSEDEEK